MKNVSDILIIYLHSKKQYLNTVQTKLQQNAQTN